MAKDAFDPSMFDLFCAEVETQCLALNEGLIVFEKNPADRAVLESLMRAAHSIKGSARIVNLLLIVPLAHAMEDCFSEAQKLDKTIPREKIDQILQAVDLFSDLAKVKVDRVDSWLAEQSSLIDSIKEKISHSSPEILAKQEPEKSAQVDVSLPLKADDKKTESTVSLHSLREQALRITTETLNKLVGLTGESLVESHLLPQFKEGLQALKNQLTAIDDSLDFLKSRARKEKSDEAFRESIVQLEEQILNARSALNQYFGDFEDHCRRSEYLSDKLYHEVLVSRMRPFGDGVESFPRMVRDLSFELKKQVSLVIKGLSTMVDRDILEKLESPLIHLIRNAVDHGIESPEERKRLGKQPLGVVTLEARHQGRMLVVTVSDDGRGINIEDLRAKIIEEKWLEREPAEVLTDSQVIDFLFQPGFSTSKQLTDISGRGVGLDIVLQMIKSLKGNLQTTTKPRVGTCFFLELPLSLSVIRALVVRISGEFYAFPLGAIDRAFLLSSSEINSENNFFSFSYEEKTIPLIPAWKILDLKPSELLTERISAVLISNGLNSYGVSVDSFLGERELVLQESDPRLGKIQDIGPGSIMQYGSLVLIIDVEDMKQSIDKLLYSKKEEQGTKMNNNEKNCCYKRILAVDDSETVREAVEQVLGAEGYIVDTAINGLDGWNALCANVYDLVITDIEMPCMKGWELLAKIKSDERFKHLPVIILSGCESKVDIARGYSLGASKYLTKGSYSDIVLLTAVLEAMDSKNESDR